MQMFKIKYESCMILVSRCSKGYAILSSEEILLQETNTQKKVNLALSVERQICVSRYKFTNPP